LRLTGTLSFAYQDALEGTNRTAANYLDACVPQPIELKLELRHLGAHADTHTLTVPASDHPSAQGARPQSMAA
jgi:hypothetical protein